MTSEQLANAQIIIEVGQQLGANAKQMLAAIEAALVESGLRNLNYGDRDSQGLFQQRPSQGWGTVAEVTDPYYAAQAFFLGAGTNHGALSVDQSGTAGNLAQRVQRSAFPSRYDQRESEAQGILGQWQLSPDQTGAGGNDGTWIATDDGSGDYFGIPDLSAYDFEDADDGTWQLAQTAAPVPVAQQAGFGMVGVIAIAIVGYFAGRQTGLI
jgi:hypothetical protein